MHVAFAPEGAASLIFIPALLPLQSRKTHGPHAPEKQKRIHHIEYQPQGQHFRFLKAGGRGGLSAVPSPFRRSRIYAQLPPFFHKRLTGTTPALLRCNYHVMPIVLLQMGLYCCHPSPFGLRSRDAHGPCTRRGCVAVIPAIFRRGHVMHMVRNHLMPKVLLQKGSIATWLLGGALFCRRQLSRKRRRSVFSPQRVSMVGTMPQNMQHFSMSLSSMPVV